MNRRWICPNCESGVLAPSRPRRDDVRRYCLDCSATTGRLVERTCPAQDAERERRAAKRTGDRKASTQRARAEALAARSAGDFDLLAEARRFVRLPALRGINPALPDRIEWRRSAGKWHTSGHCWGAGHKIVVTIGGDPYDAVATVLHELCHAALPAEHHSDRYWRLVERAAREAWPTARFDFVTPTTAYQRQHAVRDGVAGLYRPETGQDCPTPAVESAS